MPLLRPSAADFTAYVKAAAQYVPAGKSVKIRQRYSSPCLTRRNRPYIGRRRNSVSSLYRIGSSIL